MSHKKKMFSKPNSFPQQFSKLNPQEYVGEEVRGAGRQINYSGRLEKIFDKLAEGSDRDIYNNIEAFNSYERLVSQLEIITKGYHDEEYKETIECIYQEYLNPDKHGKIKILDLRYAAVMKLLKRKGFTPADDVMDDSWIIVQNVINRINTNLDAQIITKGERGTGKSSVVIQLSLAIAEKNGLDWDVNTHLFFDPLSLRDFIHKNKPAPGTPLVWDEAGASKGMGRRRAMTRESIEFNEIIQLIRELGLIIFYTAPAETNLDSGTINMFSCQIEIVRRDKIQKLKVVKYLEREKKYWMYVKDTLGNRITRIIVPNLPEDVWQDYLKRKHEFMYDRIKVKKEEKKRGVISDKKVKKKIFENQDRYVKVYGNKKIFSWQILYEDYRNKGLTQNRAKLIKQELEDELNA
jgi:hypothetical protein